MRRAWPAIAVVVLASLASGCASGGPAAGPYTVTVRDGASGTGIEGALVHWRMRFDFEAAKGATKEEKGADVAGPDGTVIIPRFVHPGSEFRELSVSATAPFHREERVSVSTRSGHVALKLEPLRSSVGTP